MIIAAVDIGSNSIKMTVARRAGDRFEEIASASATVRLGAGLAERGRLADDRIAAALETLQEFATTARAHGASRLVGVATEATRRAANGPDFLRMVHAQTGWSVRLISGDDEAALTFQGLALDHDLSGTVVVADIGGGSTEIVIATDRTIRLSQSLPLGSGTLTDAVVHADPPGQSEIDAATDVAAEAFAGVAWPGRGSHLIVVGGTAEAIARLAPADGALSREGLAHAVAAVLTGPAAELGERYDLPVARARVLPAGLAIVQALVATVHPARCSLGRSGLRAGVLLATFAEPEQPTQATAIAATTTRESR